MRVQTRVVQMDRRDLGEINIGRTRSSDDWCKGTEEIVLSLRTGENVFLGKDRFGWVEDFYV